jgi:hypothetical protein
MGQKAAQIKNQKTPTKVNRNQQTPTKVKHHHQEAKCRLGIASIGD